MPGKGYFHTEAYFPQNFQEKSEITTSRSRGVCVNITINITWNLKIL